MNVEKQWDGKSLQEMVDHLLSTHHAYTKIALESLWPLMDQVECMHGTTHPELSELKMLYARLRDDLQLHLMKEEKMLFPYVCKLDACEQIAKPHFGTIANPVRVMTMEHDVDGEIMDRIQAVTDSFTVPPEACVSYHTLYAGLRELVEDMRRHIHFENTVLFPMAIRQEQIVLEGK
ncbi:MAG: hemerythrin domain-containing protein [Nitrosomonadales bacterium]|nr:hemerythrin domain-containing protein [Nitrosomonadales bacterium]